MNKFSSFAVGTAVALASIALAHAESAVTEIVTSGPVPDALTEGCDRSTSMPAPLSASRMAAARTTPDFATSATCDERTAVMGEVAVATPERMMRVVER